MASIRKRKWNSPDGKPNEAYVVNWTDQEGKRRLKTFDKKKEADAYRVRIEGEMERNEHVADRASKTFRDAAEEYFRDAERRSHTIGVPSKASLYNYRNALDKYLLPEFGIYVITALDADHVQEFLDEWCKSLSPETVRNFRMVLNNIIRFAINKKWLRRNVLLDHGVRIRKKTPRVTVPTKTQIAHLLAAVEVKGPGEWLGPHLQRRASIVLALFCGMRLGEICGLSWECIDFEANVIRIRQSYGVVNGLKAPKTEAGVRDVPMNAQVRLALQELRAMNDVDEMVFKSSGGRLWCGGHFHASVWQPLLVRAGMKAQGVRAPFHFHALRHACVSLLIERGLNANQIAKFIGHAKPSTTIDIYGHLFPDDDSVRLALEAIPADFGATWQRHSAVTH